MTTNLFAVYIIFICIIAMILACIKECINKTNNNNYDDIPPQYNSKSSLPSYNSINI